jgi:hypothetical protein
MTVINMNDYGSAQLKYYLNQNKHVLVYLLVSQSAKYTYISITNGF